MNKKLQILMSLIFIFSAVSRVAAQSDQRDSSFGYNGIATAGISGDGIPSSIAIQKNQEILLSGTTADMGLALYNFILVRYKQNGQPDKLFGPNKNGVVITDFEAKESASAMAVQKDGKIIVAGNTTATAGCCTSFLLARYNTDGSLDSAFGDNGKTITKYKNYGTLHSIALQSDGKIIAAGSSGLDSQHFTIVRYKSNGKVDRAFGTNGVLIADSVTSGDDVAYAVQVQNDDKIVAAGGNDFSNGERNGFFIVRLNPDGSFDSSFGTNGKVYTNFGSRTTSYLRALAITKENKILAGGAVITKIKGPFPFAIAQYKSNGALDKSFGAEGKVLVSFGNDVSTITSFVLPDENKILAMVNSGIIDNGQTYNTVVKFLSNGMLDSSYGKDGKFGISGNTPVSGAIQSDGKLVVTDDAMQAIRYKSSLAGQQNFYTANISGNNISNMSISSDPVINLLCLKNPDPSSVDLKIINQLGNISSLLTGIYFLQITGSKKQVF